VQVNVAVDCQLCWAHTPYVSKLDQEDGGCLTGRMATLSYGDIPAVYLALACSQQRGNEVASVAHFGWLGQQQHRHTHLRLQPVHSKLS
jgi:hypothetical protein